MAELNSLVTELIFDLLSEQFCFVLVVLVLCTMAVRLRPFLTSVFDEAQGVGIQVVNSVIVGS